MNFQFYFEKLKSSEEFQKFQKENPRAFLCSAFFSIDHTGNDNKQHFDFFVNGKIFSFQIENGCGKTELENFSGKTLSRISENTNFEFERIEKMILDKMQEEKIKNKVQKILLSLQNVEGTDYIVGTIFISGMGLLKIKINLDEMKVEDFEKSSVFDIVKVLKK